MSTTKTRRSLSLLAAFAVAAGALALPAATSVASVSTRIGSGRTMKSFTSITRRRDMPMSSS